MKIRFLVWNSREDPEPDSGFIDIAKEDVSGEEKIATYLTVIDIEESSKSAILISSGFVSLVDAQKIWDYFDSHTIVQDKDPRFQAVEFDLKSLNPKE